MNSPYIQAVMGQAMQAIITGAHLPSNCYVMSIPIEQAQQMFPPWLMANTATPMIYAPPVSYYGQSYPPMSTPYMDYPQSNALVPYTNAYNPPFHAQNYNYPMIGYNKSKKKGRYRRKTHSEPHSNVYNSSSFDTHMENLSWSRLFGNHHHHHHRQSYYGTRDSATPSYDHKTNPSKKMTRRDRHRSSSTSTTSDETIRRVNLSAQQAATTSSSSKQQQPTKGSLPFKYSSDFVPGTGGKQSTKKTNRKEERLRSDDVFVVQNPQAPSEH